MFTKVFIIFAICSLVNVILNTLKSLVMIGGSKKMAIIVNAITYGFYTLVVKQLGSVDYVTAVVVTIITNIIGVWLSYGIIDMFKKDKIWRITVTLKDSKNVAECITNLNTYNIGYNHIMGTNSIDIYSDNQKESRIVKSILDNYEYKYFIQEMEKSL